MMGKWKITVVKRTVNQDLVDEYAEGAVPACEKFTDGQEFILDTGDKPENFCSWAWADIHRDVMIIRFGGNIPWMNRPATTLSCCTDGLRPVVFKIERID